MKPANLTPEELIGIIKYMIAVEHNIDEDLCLEFIATGDEDKCIINIEYTYEIKSEETLRTFKTVFYFGQPIKLLQSQIDVVLNELEKIKL